MRWSGQLEPVNTPHRKIGLFDRAQVEALAQHARHAGSKLGGAALNSRNFAGRSPA
jgi:hypothetical protein